MASKMSAKGITAYDDGTISADGREAVNMYAFLAIRRALKFRVETGMSMYRGQEMRAARSHGWTEGKTAKKCLADLNAIAVEMGMEAI